MPLKSPSHSDIQKIAYLRTSSVSVTVLFTSDKLCCYNDCDAMWWITRCWTHHFQWKMYFLSSPLVFWFDHLSSFARLYWWFRRIHNTVGYQSKWFLHEINLSHCDYFVRLGEFTTMTTKMFMTAGHAIMCTFFWGYFSNFCPVLLPF